MSINTARVSTVQMLFDFLVVNVLASLVVALARPWLCRIVRVEVTPLLFPEGLRRCAGAEKKTPDLVNGVKDQAENDKKSKHSVSRYNVKQKPKVRLPEV